MSKGYFDREPTIRTEKQMREILARRTGKVPVPAEGGEACPGRALERLPSAASTPAAPTLQWMAPERNADGSGRQFDETRQYEIRKSLRGSNLVYWAWTTTTKKLLGYHPTAEHCRALCQTHWEAACAVTRCSDGSFSIGSDPNAGA